MLWRAQTVTDIDRGLRWAVLLSWINSLFDTLSLLVSGSSGIDNLKSIYQIVYPLYADFYILAFKVTWNNIRLLFAIFPYNTPDSHSENEFLGWDILCTRALPSDLSGLRA